MEEDARDYFWRNGMEDNYSVVSTLVEQVKYVTFGKVQYVNLDPPCDVRTSMRTCIYIYIYIHSCLFVYVRTRCIEFQVFGPFTINSTTSAELKDLAFNATNCSSVYTTPIVSCGPYFFKMYLKMEFDAMPCHAVPCMLLPIGQTIHIKPYVGGDCGVTTLVYI